MGVTADHGAPGADVVDIAPAVDVKHVRALRALEKPRLAAHGGKGAHRRVDAAGNMLAGAVKKSLAGIHDEAKSSGNCRVVAPRSAAENSALPTASQSAPALMTAVALSTLMPPMAITVRPSSRACVSTFSGQCTASGLVGDACTLPKASSSAPACARRRARSRSL